MSNWGKKSAAAKLEDRHDRLLDAEATLMERVVYYDSNRTINARKDVLRAAFKYGRLISNYLRRGR